MARRDRYSKSYDDNLMDRIGGLLILGVIIAIVAGLIYGVQWLYHNVQF